MSSTRFLLFPAAIALLAGLSGCDEESGAKYCGTDLNTRIDATIEAAQALEVNAQALVERAATACATIATDLGVDPDDATDVEIACAAADRAIAAQLDGGLVVTVAASPPVCTFDAQAQLDCEAGCVVEGGCEPGSIETRCEPGEFSVQCDGECTAEASVICEAEAEASIQCEGSCSGICEGSCDGVCNGECDGEAGAGGTCDGECLGTCEGTCQGSCEGSCEYDAGAEATCEGEASVRCRGGCDGTATLPRCETELTPPSCDMEAECQASCEAEASFKSECEPGRIHVVVEGAGNAQALVDTLEQNLPPLLEAEAYAAIWGNAGAFADGVVDLYDGLQDNLLCLGSRGAALLGAVESAANAAASVSITVEFSACVSASTTNDGAPACEG